MKYDANGYIQVAVAASDMSEVIDDRVNSLLVAGNNIDLTYDDGAGTLTVAVETLASGDISDWAEAVDDRVNSLVVAGNNIDATYDDNANTLTIAVESLTSADISDFTEAAQDAVGGAVSTGLSYNDTTGAISCTITQYTDEMAQDSVGGICGNGLTYNDAAGTLVVDTASDSVDGISEHATAAEVTTGDDTGRTITPKALADSDYGKRVFNIATVFPTSALATGDNQAYFPIPSEISGWNLNSVQGTVYTASTAGGNGAVVINLLRTRYGTGAGSVEMLATALTLDQDEYTSVTAATAFALSATPANYAVSANATSQDVIGICIDTVGTGTCGLDVKLTFISA